MDLREKLPNILVIGYGNDLRSDDGVGQRVANAVATWGMPQVRSLAVVQLTPELAESLNSCKFVVFVDAYGASEKICAVQVHPLKPLDTGNFLLGHTSEPRSLLALTQALYNYYPRAWLVTIPAVNFELGETISAIAQQGLATALTQISILIEGFTLSP
ncbi:MAG: hydrogenase maturation protease [Symploca sp. SIO1C4]|uniref:Hydrogenase maturation protease n=1 Tax=Symploca sp. SIO1C4 TaxID=2607765 RepID=A0A6B3N430_9CYAN|nr:hydrogenase maturation protease [Symploca sp. SIO1C4]